MNLNVKLSAYLKIEAAQADCIAVLLFSALPLLWRDMMGMISAGTFGVHHWNVLE